MRRDGFLKSIDGNVALIFGLAAVPLLLVAGSAIDYSRAVTTETNLQAAADAAALAAARAAGSDAVRGQHGADIFKQQLGVGTPLASLNPAVSVRVANDVATVAVKVVQPNAFLDLAGLDVNPIGVTAQATTVRRKPVCMLALDETASDSIALAGNPDLSAPDCVVQSNSTADDAIRLQGAASGTADEFCAVGGFTTNGNGFTPPPVGHCPKVPNPLLALPPPASLVCSPFPSSYSGGTHNLTQGVYCNGLEARTHAVLNLAPGIYVIKNGPLSARAHATIRGQGVTFYFVGNNTGLDVQGGADIDIEAPTGGPYAGLAIVQQPDSNPGGTSVITGGGDLRFVGTLYMPTQTVSLRGNGQIGANSPAWSMIAARFTMQGTPDIVINADFAAAGYGDAMVRTMGGVVLAK